ncbi:MAG: arsenate reductase ArsC [Bacteriovoracia bacterium]
MKVLFLCVANSARSQMAEALARHFFPKIEVQSAGSSPTFLHPKAKQVLEEVGINCSALYSKSIDQIPPSFLSDLDNVITLCQGEVCPIGIRAKRKLHWPFPDPAVANTVESFRIVRDELKTRISEMEI